MGRNILLFLIQLLLHCGVFVAAFSSVTPSASLSSDASQSVKSETVTENVNFVDWISDAPDQIKTWKSLTVKGEIPCYVKGTLVRNGGGIWTETGNSSEGNMFSHIFDGLAKIHSYRISHDDNDTEAPTKVEFQTRFLEGEWYKKYSSLQKLPVGIGTGPVLDANKQPITGFWQTLKVAMNTIAFDNTPVNIWDYQPNKYDSEQREIVAMTDAPPRTRIDLASMNTLSSSTMNPLAKNAKGFELLCTAHPLYSQSIPSSTTTIDTYNVAVEIGTETRVNLIKESTSDSGSARTVVASFSSEDGIPYFHSFGISKNYAVLVLQPLRVDALDLSKTVELGFLRGMQHVETTRIVVVDLNSGEIVLDQSIDETIYFYHSISTAELVSENGDIEVSLRLCAYKTPDQLTGEHQFMRLEQARKGREWRNKIHPGGIFCDVVCNLEKQSVAIDWKEEIQQGFELPVTRYSRSYKDKFCPPSSNALEQPHPRYTYAFGAYALGSSDYDSWGLFKFDLEENKVAGYFSEDSVYISEPAFVADPNGGDEDDGVLLTHAYFGREQETKLLVLDAKTMKILAEASTQTRAPLDFHGAWIPSVV